VVNSICRGLGGIVRATTFGILQTCHTSVFEHPRASGVARFCCSDDSSLDGGSIQSSHYQSASNSIKFSVTKWS